MKHIVLFIVFSFAFYVHAFSGLYCLYHWQAGANKFAGEYLNIGGKTYSGYNKLHAPYFSADGTKWGFNYKSGDKWYVIINGQTFGGYDDAWDPVISSDGLKWGFNYESGKTWFININGETFGGG